MLRYEAEDPTKLVGGVAESWTVSPDAKTFVFKLRPNQKFASGAPITADDMAWSLQRVVLLDKTPAFLFTQLGWSKDNVKDLVQATDPGTVTFKITEDLAPSLVLNLMSTFAASVVEKKVAMANETNGDMGNAWLKSHSAGSGPYNLVSWKADESVTLEANPNYHLGAAAYEARGRETYSRACDAAPAAREGRHRHRPGSDAGSAHAAWPTTRTSASSPSRPRTPIISA